MLCNYTYAYAHEHPTSYIAPVEHAIQSLDWEALHRLCGDKITITIKDKTKIYSKTQGISVLNDYIGKREAHTFKVLYFGKSSDRIYAIASITKNNKKIKVLLLFERSGKNNTYLLNEINFE